MSFTEDFSIFFSDFAVDARIGSATVRGIFDNAFINTFDIASRQPIFRCVEAALATDPVGSACVIGTASYKIVGTEPDGTGLTVLRLEKQ